MAASDSNEFDYIPGYTKPGHEYGAEFGDEFHAPAVVELLASMVAYKQRGVTLKGGQGVLPTGCVIARKTSDNKYYIYNSLASDGTQTAVGFLRNARDTGTGTSAPNGSSGQGAAGTSPINLTATDCLGNLVYGGVLNLSLLSGTDNNNVTGAAGGFGSGTVTALGGRVINFGSGVGTPPFPGSSMDGGNKAIFNF
jgi:head decoration protein D